MNVACLVAFIITFAHGSVKSMDFSSLWLSLFLFISFLFLYFWMKIFIDLNER